MSNPRTYHHSKTHGFCQPPRMHLDRYIDDRPNLKSLFRDAIWDETLKHPTWVFENVNPERFNELLDERFWALERKPLGDKPELPTWTYGAKDDEPLELIDVNSKGGKQSALEGRYDLVPFSAIHEAAKILKIGADKYGVDNWRKISTESHVNHALEHLYRHLELKRLDLLYEDGDYDLGHALVRLMFAVAIDMDGEID